MYFCLHNMHTVVCKLLSCNVITSMQLLASTDCFLPVTFLADFLPLAQCKMEAGSGSGYTRVASSSSSLHLHTHIAAHHIGVGMNMMYLAGQRKKKLGKTKTE